MNCKEIRKNFPEYQKGLLTPEAGRRIAAHLEECGECRSFEHYLSSILGEIGSEKGIAPDPFLATRIEGLITPAESRQVSARMKPAPAWLIFTLILAGIAGGFGLGNLISSRPADRMAKQEIRLIMNDLMQEPVETFLMEL